MGPVFSPRFGSSTPLNLSPERGRKYHCNTLSFNPHLPVQTLKEGLTRSAQVGVA